MQITASISILILFYLPFGLPIGHYSSGSPTKLHTFLASLKLTAFQTNCNVLNFHIFAIRTIPFMKIFNYTIPTPPPPKLKFSILTVGIFSNFICSNSTLGNNAWK
jgi:hypothetical protein